MDNKLEQILKALKIKSKIEENLHIVKIMKDNNFKEAIEKIAGVSFSTPMDFLKYKVLNYIKYSKYIDNLIKEDNNKVISSIKLEVDDLGLRDSLLSKFIKTDKENPIISYVNDFNDIEELLNNIESADDEYSCRLINPFTGLEIKSYFTKTPDKKSNSYMITNFDLLINNKQDEAFIMIINYAHLNSNHDINPSDSKLKKMVFEFTVYHELAHASFSQILNNTDYNKTNKGEVNSDVSAIIKVIKNNNLSIDESLNFCNHILKFRANHAKYYDPSGSTSENFLKNYDVRIHFTEEDLLHLKQFILSNNKMLKTIPDEDITTFSEILVSSFKSNSPLLIEQKSSLSNNIMIDSFIENPKFIEAFNDEYQQSYLLQLPKHKRDDTNLSNIKKSCESLKDFFSSNFSLFKDFYIVFNLKYNYDNFVQNNLIDNPNVNKEIIERYSNYRFVKNNNNVEIPCNFTHFELKNKLNNKPL